MTVGNKFIFIAPHVVSTTNGGFEMAYESDCEIWATRHAAQSHGLLKLRHDDFVVAEVEVAISANIRRVVAVYVGDKRRDDIGELFRINNEFGWNQ